MYVWGGFGANFDILNDAKIYRFNLSSLTVNNTGGVISASYRGSGWVSITASNTVRPSAAHAAVTNGQDAFWVYGGYAVRTTSDSQTLWWPTSQLIRYNISSNTWTNLVDTGTAALLPSSVSRGNNLTNAFCATWAWDTGLAANASIHCVTYPGLVLFGNNIYTFGGMEGFSFESETSFAEYHDNAMYSYSIVTNTWTKLHPYDCGTSRLPECRFGFVMTVKSPGTLVLFGGEKVPYNGDIEDAVLTNSMWEYDVTTRSWKQTQVEQCDTSTSAELLPSCVSMAAGTQLNQSLVLFGGEIVSPGQSQFTNTFLAHRPIPTIINATVTERPTAGSTNLGTRCLHFSIIVGGVYHCSLTQLHLALSLRVFAVINGSYFGLRINDVSVSILGPIDNPYAQPVPCGAPSFVPNVASLSTNDPSGYSINAISCSVPPGVGANNTVIVTINDIVSVSSNSTIMFSYAAPSISSLARVTSPTTGGLLNISGKSALLLLSVVYASW